MKVLLAEDDSALGRFVSKGLAAEDYVVELVNDGADVAPRLEQSEFDLLILDLNLPTVDGISALKRVRAADPSIPILILTARNQVQERVQCLDLGADDYVTKPFSFVELSARIRALLRRRHRPQEPVLKVADLELNRVQRIVKRNGKAIDLSPKEFTLLEYLLQNQGRRVTRAMILDHVWSLSFDTSTNVVDVYINYLRKKIDDGHAYKLIHTVRGVGYELKANDD